MSKRVWALAASVAAIAAPASAEWHQASSKHFVIYSDDTPENIKAYAERLERFDAAARVVRKMDDPEIGDGNRVQVFIVPSLLEVNRLYGSAEAGVGGYYVGMVSGPFIVTPRKTRRVSDSTTKIDPETVFFHEYTHHLMLQNTNTPMPSWLTEGFAEFFANPIFRDDGSVGLGTPATHRAEQLFQTRWAPLAHLLEGKADTLGYVGFWHQNYAQGWLLNHYLAFEPSRRGQVDEYVRRIAKGEDALTAARGAFGDIERLDRELQEYKRRKNFAYLNITPPKSDVDPVTVAALPPGSAEVMPQRIQVKTGYGGVTVSSVLEKVRGVAARYPNDPLVLRTLAEAEFDKENFDRAEAAADAALKLEPKSTEALVYKGRALLARGKKASDTKLIEQARRYFVSANKIDPEDPEPLYLFYRTYRALNAPAPKNAIAALNYAAVLAPRHSYVTIQLVMEHLRHNDLKAAGAALRPLAYSPHAGKSKRNETLEVLNLIEAGKGSDALARFEKELKDVAQKEVN